MATYYVSNQATNDYRIGVDSGAGTTKATAWLTLTYALTQVGADDTIVLNDGTYNEASFLAPADSGLTINSETRHGAIIRAASGTTRVFHVAVAAITFGEIVIDANSAQDYCFTTGTITDIDLTFNGTKFVNPNISFCALSRQTNVTFQSNWLAEGVSLSGHGIQILYTAALATAGAVNISDGVMNVTDMTSNGRRGINITSTDLAGCSANINNVSITLGTPTTPANSTGGIYINDTASTVVYNNTVVINDSLSAIGIAQDVSAVDTTDTFRIYNNNITLPSAAINGYGVQAGSDSDTVTAGDNSLTNPQVFGNTLTGGDHGILMGGVTDGCVFDNFIDNVDLGVVLKRTTTCQSTGNVIIDCADGGALRFKGATNSIHANNLVYYTGNVTVSSGVSMQADAASVTNSTGCGFYNNCVYSLATIADYVFVAASSTATFQANNYYLGTGGVVSGNPFNYQGTPYADLAAWNLAATVSNETETDPSLNTTTYQVEASGLETTGYKWWTGIPPVGYGGEPFPSVDITIGAVQSKDVPFHPTKL